MRKCFAEWKTFNEDLSAWNTPSMTNMEWMFGYSNGMVEKLARLQRQQHDEAATISGGAVRPCN